MKPTLDDLSNLNNPTTVVSTINQNNSKVEEALENTLSRDGTSPNQMGANIDMNNNRVINLPYPESNGEPVRKSDLSDILGLSNGYLPTDLDAGHIVTGTLSDARLSTTYLVNKTVNNPTIVNGVQNTPTIHTPIVDGGTYQGGVFTAVSVLNSGLLSGNNKVLTGTYTVPNSDKGSILILTGSDDWALTFNTSGYDADFIVGVSNSDTAGHYLTLGSSTAFWLWPGQGVIVSNNGSDLFAIGKPSRYFLLNPILYVDVVNGNDNNDGLAISSSRALKSIGKALARLQQDIDGGGSYPHIKIANGTYTESVQANVNPPGSSVIFLDGASSGGVIWQPASATTPYCFLPSDGAIFEITNIYFDGGGITGSVAIQMHQFSIVDILSGCGFGSFGGGYYMNSDGAGWTFNINANVQLYGAGGASIAFAANSNGTINIYGGVSFIFSNGPNIGIFWSAGAGGVINMGSGLGYSGAPLSSYKKWNSGAGGFISFAGTSTSMPAGVAGTPALNAAPTGTSGWAI